VNALWLLLGIVFAAVVFGDLDIDGFWAAVATNLKAGRVRLVFVADVIPSELKRVIEFLNEQMNPAEVVGIEVKQFAGGTFRTLAARMIGVTEQAREQRRVRTRRGAQREWDEQSFFADLGERADMAAVDVASQILDWARSTNTAFSGWVGLSTGECKLRFVPVNVVRRKCGRRSTFGPTARSKCDSSAWGVSRPLTIKRCNANSSIGSRRLRASTFRTTRSIDGHQ
jgi:hypothetical protein